MKTFYFALLLSLIISSVNAQTASITADQVAVRLLPQRSSTLLTRLPKNTSVEVLDHAPKGIPVKINGKPHGWHQIAFLDKGEKLAGFVCSKYVKFDRPAISRDLSNDTLSRKINQDTRIGIVNFNGLKLRSKPATSSTTILTLKSNAKVEIIVGVQGAPVFIKGKKYEWYKVVYKENNNNHIGYVCEKYITITPLSKEQQLVNKTDTVDRQHGFINHSNVGLRKGPDSKSDLIGRFSVNTELDFSKKVYKGVPVIISDKEYGWYKVEITHESKPVSGYICEKYISVTPVHKVLIKDKENSSKPKVIVE